MKKFFYLLATLFITLSSTAQDQARFIPANAFVVTEFNLKALYEKGNLEEIKKLEIFQVWEKEMSREFDERYDAAKVMWNNPAATGIDLNGFAYYFLSAGKEDQQDDGMFGFILPVKNAATLEDYLLNKLKLGNGKKVAKAGKMKMLSNSRWAVIWGGDALMYVEFSSDPSSSFPEYDENISDKQRDKIWAEYNAKQEAWVKKQATLVAASTPTGSILQEQHFRDFHAKNYDMGLYIHNSKDASLSLINQFLRISLGSSFSNSAIFDNHYSCFGLTFDKGAITVISQSFYSPRLAQYIEPVYSTHFNPSLLRYINSKEAIAFSTISFSMPALKKVLKEKADTLTQFAETQFVRQLYAKEVKRDQQVQTYNDQISELNDQIYASYGATDSTSVDFDYSDSGDGDATEDVSVADTTVAVEDYSYNSYTVDYDKIEQLNKQIDSIEVLRDKRSDEVALSLIKKDGFEPSWIWDLTGGDMLYSLDELYPEVKSYEYQDIDAETYETKMVTHYDTIPYPHYTMVVSVADKNKVEKLLTIMTKQGYLKNKGSYYSLVADPKHEHFIYFSNGNLIITNNSKLAVLNKDGFKDGRGYDPILAARCQENIMLFRFNTDILMNSLKKTENKRNDVASFNIIEKYIGAFEADAGKMQQGQHTGKTSLEFGSTQEFSLLQLFRFSNDLYLLYNK